MRIKRTLDPWGDISYRNEKGDLHREDGPAYESSSGIKTWWVNEKRHREDGPAVVFSDGTEWYYLNGREYTKDKWEQEVLKLKLGRIKDL